VMVIDYIFDYLIMARIFLYMAILFVTFLFATQKLAVINLRVFQR
jgi:hypothetical protein